MAETNYKRKLVDYFKKNLAKGYTPDTLKIALFNQGYSKSIIERTLEIANHEFAEKS
jgi:SOS response regulatory protein OraA/RecX